MKLVIAEKPSVARSIAVVLGATKRGNGHLIGKDYLVSWCVGHLVELADPADYNPALANWKKQDLPIIPQVFKHKAIKSSQDQLKIIRDLIKREDVTEIINACDAGREGELIFRLSLKYARTTKPTKRLWISSLEDKAIKDGFDQLKSGDDYNNLYAAALCRSQADWVVGINYSRLFSIIYSAPLSVGRVISPTLALIVNREAQIANFVKEPFYTPELDTGSFKATYKPKDKQRIKDKQVAEDIATVCEGKTATATGVDNAKKTTAPPKLFDLTSLQRDANRLFGYTAADTLSFAQSLYEKKLLTYPRTDSKFLSDDMESGLSSVIAAVNKTMDFINADPATLKTKQVIDNKKVADHHAIIPTKTIANANLHALPPGERDILETVASRFIEAMSPKMTYNETTITLECEGYVFATKGKTITDLGFKAIEQSFKARKKTKDPEDTETEDNQTLPKVTKGDTFAPVHVVVKEGSTSAPKSYTEDTLLKSMETAGVEELIEDDIERKGLGTPATRAEIIERLVRKEFVVREAKKLLPTPMGVNLIQILPDKIKSPSLTAEWENRLKLVERGEMAGDDFMADIATFVRTVTAENGNPQSEHLALFPRREKQKPVGDKMGKCPYCPENIVAVTKITRDDKKKFMYTCENTQCHFTLWEDNMFFTNKKIKLTKTRMKELLKKGSLYEEKLYSQKTDKEYAATITIDPTPGKYVNFQMAFGVKPQESAHESN